MSGEGPESIPTSADPRSKRPTKKRALTPVSAQANVVEALFSKPDQEIRIPDASAVSRKRDLPPPPEIVTNVQGSSAGAGSGEFHVYKASRRREYERLRRMDEEVSQEKAKEEFEKSREEREKRDDEKTRRNREKREKAKARKAKVKNGSGGGGAAEKKDDGGNKPVATVAPLSKGVKARADAKKDDTVETEKKTSGETPAKEDDDAPVEEPKGIVIEED
ncbi:PRKR-interacting protein 1 [Daldinia childiae]|uniref:PRKR-interacting protein 1 n=1 Tax=Daldinia childiae TaxID=326645 RepID=UPI001446815A|nr:PRKR-interacting protein 1 [Daldinia childiae]KAF3070927.1 PRKR-interacting protein 1 [Daldinia childiae]